MDQNSSNLQSKRTAAPHSRQNKTQDSLTVTSNLPDDTQGHQVNMQAPMPIIHTQEPNIQDPSTSTPMPRRVSIQEPPASFLPRRSSTPAAFSPSTIPPRRFSIQETHSQGSQLDTQDILSVAYNRWLRSREDASLNSNTLCSIQSETDTDRHLSLIQSHKLKNVDVLPSITGSPEARVRSFESFVWDSKESLTGVSHHSVSSHSTLGSFFKQSNNYRTAGSSRIQSKRWSLLPVGWKLLLEAKKISRYFSLVLTVASMLILNLTALWRPWIHFQVPLVPPGDPTGPRTIPIDTIFFKRCPDISCMNEYDKNAYLLDLAWACLLISGVMSFCVCMGLISTIFFPSTNMPLMDFSLFVCSLMTGVSIILAVLFYLMQARKFLQEGMTYTLGSSFYMAWTNVFFFFMIGLFSYLNYMNFWSILAVQALWS
ncbi:uncharacterized protein LOC121136206 isoform X2 [Mesocricetus auratus]|uniref:Uncharacterized protein LOC121136206 isoform X2 n=1 Tax=Mesocricetus auratus TaxID=10036 RepID=A0ABM2WU95_MESAU|nr:uncharacterized protein LOC121136206 isoform X2 [Mesocricetus auratus]